MESLITITLWAMVAIFVIGIIWWIGYIILTIISDICTKQEIKRLRIRHDLINKIFDDKEETDY
jgi:hypothetical protein